MLCPDLHAPPTRNTGPKSHKGDGIDAVFKIDKAAEVTGDVAYNGRVPPDKQNADYKGWVASPDSCKSKAHQSNSKSKTIVQQGLILGLKEDGGFPGPRPGAVMASRKPWHL